MQYDIAQLELLPIQEVIIALGGGYQKDSEPSSKQYNMHCCNGSFHKEGDKKPSLTIWKEKNICKCHVCGIGGSSISVAKIFLGDFKKACEWLHDTFSVPYIEGVHSKPIKFEKPIKVQKEIEYMHFDKSHVFKKIVLNDWIGKYQNLSKVQRLKMVYSYIYRYALTTDRKLLIAYYQGRGISNNPHLDKIGFLSHEDIKTLTGQLNKNFPLEDLIEFGIINDAAHKFPFQWKQLKNTLLIPAFDIYTDLIEGFMLRPIDKSNSWFKGKEKRLSIPHILKPLPFGMGYKMLSATCDIYITEGHVDAFSLPHELCFVAVPGVQAFEIEQLGLLRGRNIKLCFDQDEAGQEAGIELQKNLLKAGVNSVEILSWDKKLGKDLNDLLVNGHLLNLF